MGVFLGKWLKNDFKGVGSHVLEKAYRFMGRLMKGGLKAFKSGLAGGNGDTVKVAFKNQSKSPSKVRESIPS